MRDDLLNAFAYVWLNRMEIAIDSRRYGANESSLPAQIIRAWMVLCEYPLHAIGDRFILNVRYYRKLQEEKALNILLGEKTA